MLDARLSRRFKLRESLIFEVYGEAANLFNIKSVASYATTILSAGNVNTSLVDPRTGQLIGELPDFSAGLTNWRPARAVQLGLKIHF